MDAGTARLSIGFRGVGCQSTAPGQIVPNRISPNAGILQNLSFGTDAGQINLISLFQLTLSGMASQTFNMYDGSILDVFNLPAAYRNLKMFVAWVESGGNDNGVTVGPGASNGNELWWSGTNPKKTIYPAGAPECGGSPAGVTVDATHATILVTNNGADDVVVGIALAGTDT